MEISQLETLGKVAGIGGIAIGYGLKVWPEDFATVKLKAPEAGNLEGL